MKLLRKKIEKRNLKLRQRNLKLRGEARSLAVVRRGAEGAQAWAGVRCGNCWPSGAVPEALRLRGRAGSSVCWPRLEGRLGQRAGYPRGPSLPQSLHSQSGRPLRPFSGPPALVPAKPAFSAAPFLF